MGKSAWGTSSENLEASSARGNLGHSEKVRVSPTLPRGESAKSNTQGGPLPLTRYGDGDGQRCLYDCRVFVTARARPTVHVVHVVRQRIEQDAVVQRATILCLAISGIPLHLLRSDNSLILSEGCYDLSCSPFLAILRS